MSTVATRPHSYTSSSIRSILSRVTRGQHIVMLCQQHGIKRTVTTGRGHAKVKERQIWHQPLRDEMAYFVALHEIGHVLIGLEGTRLEREGLAWQWALDNAIVVPVYPTRQRIAACLLRYLFRAQSNDWPVPEDGSHPFWRLMRWWEPT